MLKPLMLEPSLSRLKGERLCTEEHFGLDCWHVLAQAGALQVCLVRELSGVANDNHCNPGLMPLVEFELLQRAE